MTKKKTVRKPKTEVKTGVMWFVRAVGSNGFLCTRKMPLTRARQEGVFIPERGQKILSFPLPGREGASLCLTWKLEPEPKPKKKPAKKATKKRRK